MPSNTTRAPLASGRLELEAEAIAGVGDAARLDGIEKLPAEVAPAIGEVRQHRLDGIPAGAGPEEVVIVDAVGREQVGQGVAIAGRSRGGEALHQFAELHGVLLGIIAPTSPAVGWPAGTLGCLDTGDKPR